MLRIHLLKIFNIKTPQALAAHTLIARPLNPEDTAKSGLLLIYNF